MKKLLLVPFILSLSSAVALAGTVEPAVSVICWAPHQAVTNFSFDLYATGHPMGGVTMFTGMFQVISEGVFACKKGFIRTMPPLQGKLNFRAELNCASSQELSLVVDTDLFHKDVPYPARLSYREVLPIGSGNWTEQGMVCTQN